MKHQLDNSFPTLHWIISTYLKAGERRKEGTQERTLTCLYLPYFSASENQLYVEMYWL